MLVRKLVVFIFCILLSAYHLHANTLDVAKEFIDSKKYSQSLDVLKSLNKSNPENIEAIYYLALNFYLLGNYEDTIKYSVQAYTQNHKLAKEVRQYSNKQNFGSDLKIGLMRKIRLAKQIRNELYLVLQNEPDNINAHYALSYYYIYAPYIISGSVKKSLYHIEQVAKADKQRAYPIYNDYYKKIKNSEKYLDNLNQWRRNYSNDWDATIEQARYEQKYGDLKDSYMLISDWINTNGNDAKAIYQLGRLAATSGKYLDEGEESLKKYLTIPHDIDNPEYKWAHYRLSMIYKHLKDITKAQEHITKALEIDADNKEFLKFKAKL